MSTYSQIYLQIVFAVQGRNGFLRPSFEAEVFRYISGIVSGNGQKSLAVNGMPDHVHLVVGLLPSMRISDLVREVKSESSKFINRKRWLGQRFNWQEGYDVFSYSRSHLGNVIDYVVNQKVHHRKRTFRSEYLNMLDAFGISFQHEYLFEFYDGNCTCWNRANSRKMTQ